MKYLGIDQSYTSCGCVIIDDADNLLWVNVLRAETFDDIFERAYALSWDVSELVLDDNPDYIAVEGLAFGMRGNSTRDLAGLQFSIVNAIRFWKTKKNVEVISPLSLKKFATGSGKAKKEQMIEALPSLVKQHFLDLGYKKTTGLTDVTDAFWLAKYIQHKYSTPTD